MHEKLLLLAILVYFSAIDSPEICNIFLSIFTGHRDVVTRSMWIIRQISNAFGPNSSFLS